MSGEPLTYTVELIKGLEGRDWKWRVKGYRGTLLLLHTTHKTNSSKDMEVFAWESRGHKLVPPL